MICKEILIKTIIIIIIVFQFSSYISVSSNRIITSSTDDWYTSIRNSNGNFWSANLINIQYAIDDLNNNSGIVWLPGNKTFWITNTIIIWKNICLDMQGAEFGLPSGTDCIVVELRDGSSIKNGVIDVSGHQPGTFYTNTSFCNGGQKPVIFLNASSNIDSALISNMHIESSSFNNVSTPTRIDTFDSPRYGRGYGIYLYASDIDVLQKIENVVVEDCYFRCFQHALFLENERGNTGTNTAHIDNNKFENIWINGCYESMSILRNNDATSDNCSTAYNYFNCVHMQTGRSSYYGGESITYHHLHVDGCCNTFKNLIIWDFLNHHQGSGYNINLTSDSINCFVSGRGMNYGSGYFVNNGNHNTIMSFSTSTIECYDIINMG